MIYSNSIYLMPPAFCVSVDEESARSCCGRLPVCLSEFAEVPCDKFCRAAWPTCRVRDMFIEVGG
jgi:hypothetical protein